jgi:ribose/xylose/arabinose/galactoside ABC-type transport system permease subunit
VGLRGAGVLVAVAALVIAGALLSSEFLSTANLVNAMRGVALLGIVATGVSFVTYSGHYADLSVPAVMATAGTTAVAMLPFGLAPALLGALGVGAATGLVNGWAVGYLRVNPVIWTLAAGTVIEGLLRWTIGGRQIYPDASAAAGQQFLALYGASVGPVPVVLVVLAVVGALGHLLLARTRFGAELALVGSAHEAARLAGSTRRAGSPPRSCSRRWRPRWAGSS